MIETFNETHPTFTVERRTSRSQQIRSSLFEEGQVDVFVFLSEDELFANLYESGQILNLTPLIQANDTVNLDDLYPSALEPYTIEGKVWAIPAGVNLGVIYYNKDILDLYGVDYPQLDWTWDDLQRTASLARDPETDVYGLASYPFFVIPFIYQHGGRVVDDWRAPTRLAVDDPLTIEAVEWYASLIHDHDVMPSPQEATRQFGNEGNPGYIFWRSKTAMYVGFFSDRGGQTWGRQGGWQMNWGMAPLPRDERASTMGSVLGYAASADTRYPQACWEWITYLSRQMLPFVMPARRSLAESAAFEQEVGTEAAAVARAAIEEAMIVSNVQMASLGAGGDDFDQVLEEILNGDADALAALTELQRQVDAQ
jgi:multiple sugar transport system substrate-binding protein